MVAERIIGQYYFHLNPAGTTLEFSPTSITEPEPAKFPDFASRAIDLNYRDIGDNELTYYDNIIKRWFSSPFGPARHLQLIYQEFIRPSPDYWDTQEYEARFSPVDFGQLTEKLIKQVSQAERVTFREAIALINEAFDVFEGLAGDLFEFFPPKKDRLKKHPILFYDASLSKKFVKQLALAGVFTQTQFRLLNETQIAEIQNIRVPKKLCCSRNFVAFFDQLEELQPSSIQKLIFYFHA